MQMGHEVRLLLGKAVKAFVTGNKSDAADARAIWLAVQQPGMKRIAVKTEEQQAVLECSLPLTSTFCTESHLDVLAVVDEGTIKSGTARDSWISC